MWLLCRRRRETEHAFVDGIGITGQLGQRSRFHLQRHQQRTEFEFGYTSVEHRAEQQSGIALGKVALKLAAATDGF